MQMLVICMSQPMRHVALPTGPMTSKVYVLSARDLCRRVFNARKEVRPTGLKHEESLRKPLALEATINYKKGLDSVVF